MGFLLFFSWWYGPGWVNSFSAIFDRVRIVSQELSLDILVRTLFEPWKQITLYNGPNASLDTKIHVLLDNVFARIFGFVIRSAVVIFGLFVMCITFILGIVLAITWPIIPALPVLCIFLAVMA